VSKEYHYYLSFAKIENPILHDVVFHVPSLNEKPVDLEKMNQACSLFTGEHDFGSFSIQNLNRISTIRRIFACEIQKAEFSTLDNDVYFLKIEGNGFLRQMIRYIVGAMINVGRNQLPLAHIAEALNNQSGEILSPKVKARGLHLIRVRY
jgi:tRNA pseudouridine38-40 synthase